MKADKEGNDIQKHPQESQKEMCLTNIREEEGSGGSKMKKKNG